MQPFPFFALPVELRSHVLTLALRSQKELHQISADESPVNTDILTANSQWYNEALPIFYQCNIFRVHIYQGYESLPPWILHPSEHLACIRKVHVHISSWKQSYRLWRSNQGPIPAVVRTLKMCSQLRSLEIIIAHPPFKRKALMGVPSPHLDPPNVDDVMQAFEGVPGAREIVVLSHDWLGNASRSRKLRAEIEALKQRLRNLSGMSWNITSRDGRQSVIRSFRGIASLISDLRR